MLRLLPMSDRVKDVGGFWPCATKSRVLERQLHAYGHKVRFAPLRTGLPGGSAAPPNRATCCIVCGCWCVRTRCAALAPLPDRPPTTPGFSRPKRVGRRRRGSGCRRCWADLGVDPSYRARSHLRPCTARRIPLDRGSPDVGRDPRRVVRPPLGAPTVRVLKCQPPRSRFRFVVAGAEKPSRTDCGTARGSPRPTRQRPRNGGQAAVTLFDSRACQGADAPTTTMFAPLNVG